MAKYKSPSEYRTNRFLFVFITIGPFLIGILSAMLLYIERLPSEDFKWIIGICFLFSLLGFAVDRIVSFKGFGIEAQLAEINEATQKAYASVSEMNQLQQQIRSLGEHLAKQQALVVMETNRYVGDDYLSERILTINKLKNILENVEASQTGIDAMLNAVTPYIRRDLNSDAFQAILNAMRTNKNEKVKEILKDSTEFRETFYNDFIDGYEVGTTANMIFAFLSNLDIESTDEIQHALKRLDSFLGEGKYLNLEGEHILTFPNPQA